MTALPPNEIEYIPADGRPTAVRFQILALLALAPACAYLMRIISAANTTIAAEFQATDSVMGQVMSGFALGYFVLQIPGGFLASAFGVRRTLPLMGLAWSLCALWSSFAGSPEELRLARVGLGFSQAGLVPCCAQALTHWFPVARRGMASSVMAGSMQLGGIAATELTAILLDPVGWRGAMRAYSVVGMLWAVVFYVWYRNHPVEHRRVNSAERELIEFGRGAEPSIPSAGEPPSASRGWLEFGMKMGVSVSLWAFLVQAAFRAYANEFFYTWCPAFLEKGYGLDKVEAASLATLPLWSFGIGSLVSGYVVDAVLRRTGSRWMSRSGSAILGLTLCGVCFVIATQMNDPRLVIALMTVGGLSSSLAGPATWATAMDLGGRRTAVLAGSMNMLGNIGAFFCPRHVGRLFESIENSAGNWNLVLWLFAGVYFAGATTWIFVKPQRALTD